MHVDIALKSRKSVRAFRPDPVPLDVVQDILEVANRAPSGTNIQPWGDPGSVYVVAGAVRDRLVAEVLAHRETGPEDVHAEFPRVGRRKEPYTARMKTLGKEMYGLLGIPKGDKEANWRQWGRNYEFFDAPVGLIFTIDKELDRMSYVDYGLFLQSIMLAAKARGLDTCAQGAWNNFWTVTRRVLEVPDDRYIICGISLGYADEAAPVNTLVADREPVASFASFHGFER